MRRGGILQGWRCPRGAGESGGGVAGEEARGQAPLEAGSLLAPAAAGSACGDATGNGEGVGGKMAQAQAMKRAL
eukprot:scaffold16304_cov117-Isochrysis_galbana.AAC.5